MTVLIIVIDGFGVGAMPDAEKYGDEGANTALHTASIAESPGWPTLKKLGLGNSCEELMGFSLPGCKAVKDPMASYGVMSEKSPGRDTTTGHWEIAGIILEKPFPNFPPDFPSFPEKFTSEFERAIGRKILGNKAASGTEIIQELGDEHVRSGYPICYTAGDSVFQIAAHEKVIPVHELYKISEIAREICDEYNIARVIARPFIGSKGHYRRTKRRKDFSIGLPQKSVFDILEENGIETVAVGKIGDLFNESGFSASYHDKGNKACLRRVKKLIRVKHHNRRCIFCNLVDTDMLYGHRRNPEGYYNEIMFIDNELDAIIALLGNDDVLIVTSDHGCDPTYKGTDHTREYVPLLVYQKSERVKNLGMRDQFTDVAASVSKYFGIITNMKGQTF